MANGFAEIHTFAVWVIVLWVIQVLILLGIAFTVCWNNTERRVVRRPRWRTNCDTRRLNNNVVGGGRRGR